MRVLALDYGAARTGVAVSDADRHARPPVGCVERAATDAGLDRLASLVAEHRGGAGRRRAAADAARRARRAGAARPSASSTALETGVDGSRRDLRRALHDDARAADAVPPPRRTRWQRRTCCRAGSTGRARGDESAAAAVSLAWSRCSWRVLLAAACGGDSRAARRDDRGAAAARAAAHHLPGGLHGAGRWATASPQCAGSRSTKRGVTPQADPGGHTSPRPRRHARRSRS